MILAGYSSRNVDILDEKRDKSALGIALVTVPISIVGAISGAEVAAAEPTGLADDQIKSLGSDSPKKIQLHLQPQPQRSLELPQLNLVTR